MEAGRAAGVQVGEALRGRRFFVTGGTGFLGTALIERILRTIPDAHVTVLIRPGRRASAADRATREILKNDCFDRLRADHEDNFAETVAQRLDAVPGDVSQDGLGLDDDGRARLASADVVIHSAATVSFDAPLDQAVEINLLGPSRVAAALRACEGKAHLIAVSTAYVAGTHQGDAPEVLLDTNRYSIDADADEEITHARRLRADFQAASRSEVRLAGFWKEARRELGGAGTHLLAARSEKLRQEWIESQLVEAGTSRARSLGWPDAYPFTKALGERLLVATHGDHLPITIVRPSIIESALAEPRPGWIRGFRMAEPIIVSYARGLLREFPGVPEGVIDVIPVDMVVAAILAVAARGPLVSTDVIHVASGVRNPLRYGRLVELVQEWFGKHPVYDDRGQPISVPEWSFPGRGRVQRQLQRATKAMDLVERTMTALPLRGRQASLSASLDRSRSLAGRALGYVQLYGAYTETEARYRVDRLLALRAGLDPASAEAFNFDPLTIDWDRYVRKVHLPSVVAHSRLRMKPGRTGNIPEGRPERSRRAILAPERHLAVFDLEQTLVASNVVDTYAWLASRHMTRSERARFVGELLRDAPGLLALDRRDRGDFLRSFYRRYDGADPERLAADALELFHRHMLTRAFPAGFARVRAHRRAGHRTLLITGALDFLVAPLRPLFDDVLCAELGRRTSDGRYDGAMLELPPIGEARALVLEEYAGTLSLDLAETVAYADSASDLAMLEVVGFPVAVNPESRLSAIARRRGWHVENWPKASGGANHLLPLGPFDDFFEGRPKTGTVAASATREVRQ